MAKRILFIDRDGVLVQEAPPTYQLDSFDKLRFYPGVFSWLGRIAAELDFELVMVTNQDGLGTPTFPEDSFWPVHNHIVNSLASEGIRFSAIHIDRTFPHENAPTRKPGTGMLTAYMNTKEYDLAASVVIGDRITDMQLAANLGCKGIWMVTDTQLGATDTHMNVEALRLNTVVLESTSWEAIYGFLKMGVRQIAHSRHTAETKIDIVVNLDGTGKSNINTGLGFFNHMLDQIARHGGMDLSIQVQGDLHIDEHHTIEDTGIALGEALGKALGNKLGMERYGFCLPMDDCEAQVSIDFGGRAWLVWEATFMREKVGDMPTEMFYHFFKSLSDAARCNLNIKATGNNEHHKIEAIFKAFAKSIRMAVKRNPLKLYLPTTKGML
ncbi:MAG TPA: bifunctional histidinol-phosphatase/imidazoleglycerol-phosphate dehydratase HisB [Phnomibacter sp.]|nr:bifunctional histidinol-phosphatase/imidazoleglycerol-phosphate dehydratase HisB [Phnomibacter sp.]